MINFNSLPRTLSAAVGAVFISTLFVAAAVGPAHAVDPNPVVTASAQASGQAHA